MFYQRVAFQRQPPEFQLGQNEFVRRGTSGFVFLRLSPELGSFRNFAMRHRSVAKREIHHLQRRLRVTGIHPLFVDLRTLRSCNSHIARWQMSARHGLPLRGLDSTQRSPMFQGRFGRSAFARSSTTTCRATASATRRPSFAGARTSLRKPAATTSSRSSRRSH